LWQQADEQHLPTDGRRRLAAQGLRCGILVGQPPPWIRQRLEKPRRRIRLLDDSQTAVICGHVTQGRLQCHAGQRHPITVATHRNGLLLDNECDGHSPAVTYDGAQCTLALVTTPKPEGRVHMELTPEISHGRPHQHWTGEDGSFRIDVARDCRQFADSRIDALLSPGQILVLSATPDAKCLGKAFFLDGVSQPTTPEGRSLACNSEGVRDAASAGDARDAIPHRSQRNDESCGNARSTYRQKILLLRLAQTQLSDLFAPERTLAPIATPAQ
jgi:hypothetical protein